MISKKFLETEYKNKKKSAAQIADNLNCSENKINYWLKKHNIKKRSVSEAIYVRSNPEGDPFEIREPRTKEEAFLYGLGLGLYWGEGTKASKHTVRLGNTDPNLIKKFIEFLKVNFDIKEEKLRFGLQLFSDMSEKEALGFWSDFLGYPESYFQKVVITPARSIGTYKNKTKYGVLTVHFNNKKLRDFICKKVENL